MCNCMHKGKNKQVLYVFSSFILHACCYHSNYIATAGFDFKEGHFTATFAENSKDATVEIPIVADFDSQEGNESFSVQLSLQSREILSDLPYITHVRLGSIPQAKVRILEENILKFLNDSVEVREGENLTLTVTASTASVRDFTFNVSITGSNDDEFKGSQCKLIDTSVTI